MGIEVEKGEVKDTRNGPHGLGDPDDKRLRKVERNVLVKNKVREVARERCVDYINIFKECVSKNGLLVPFLCRAENNAQMDCLKRWFEDEELNEQMTREYLEERTYFRANGVPKKKQEKRIGSH